MQFVSVSLTLVVDYLVHTLLKLSRNKFGVIPHLAMIGACRFCVKAALSSAAYMYSLVQFRNWVCTTTNF